MTEIWKSISGYEGMYEVSSLGNIRSLDRYIKYMKGKSFRKGRLMNPTINDMGYYTLILAKDGVHKRHKVHHLVADAFLSQKRNGNTLVVDHINSITTDNRACNLQILTMYDNIMKERMNNGVPKSGVKYVIWSKSTQKWQATPYINGRQVGLGVHSTVEEAQMAISNYILSLNK